MATLEIVSERVTKNTEEIRKIDRCLFGRNGSGGGFMGEHEVVKNNLKWIKWLLSFQIPVLLGILAVVIENLLK